MYIYTRLLSHCKSKCGAQSPESQLVLTSECPLKAQRAERLCSFWLRTNGVNTNGKEHSCEC